MRESKYSVISRKTVALIFNQRGASVDESEGGGAKCSEERQEP